MSAIPRQSCFINASMRYNYCIEKIKIILIKYIFYIDFSMPNIFCIYVCHILHPKIAEFATTYMAHTIASAILSSEATFFFARSAWISVQRSHLIRRGYRYPFVHRSREHLLYRLHFLARKMPLQHLAVLSLNHDKFYTSFLIGI